MMFACCNLHSFNSIDRFYHYGILHQDMMVDSMHRSCFVYLCIVNNYEPTVNMCNYVACKKNSLYVFFLLARIHESTMFTKLKQMLLKVILFKLASGYHMNCTRVRSFVLFSIVCVLLFCSDLFVSLVSLLRDHRFLYQNPMAINENEKERNKRAMIFWTDGENKSWNPMLKQEMTSDERWMANGEQQKPQ